MNDLMKIYDRLSDEVERIEFSRPVASIYNPLRYAREGLEKYLEKYYKHIDYTNMFFKHINRFNIIIKFHILKKSVEFLRKNAICPPPN